MRVCWRCSWASTEARAREGERDREKTKEEGGRGKGDNEVGERKTRRRGRAVKWKCRRKRSGKVWVRLFGMIFNTPLEDT